MVPVRLDILDEPDAGIGLERQFAGENLDLLNDVLLVPDLLVKLFKQRNGGIFAVEHNRMAGQETYVGEVADRVRLVYPAFGDDKGVDVPAYPFVKITLNLYAGSHFVPFLPPLNCSLDYSLICSGRSIGKKK